MTAHDLSPISAALAGYIFTIHPHRKANGVPMHDVTAETAKNAAPKRADEPATLDNRYGEIGISAVVAAVRYQGGAKNPAYAPCSNEWRDLIADVAA